MSMLDAWVMAFGLAAFLVAIVALPMIATGIMHVRKLDLLEAVGWVALAVVLLAQVAAFA
jgi:hypothetical protein